MIANGYTYWYWWAKFRGKVTIVEVRKYDDSDTLDYEIPASDGYFEKNDFEWLEYIEDYHD